MQWRLMAPYQHRPPDIARVAETVVHLVPNRRRDSQPVHETAVRERDVRDQDRRMVKLPICLAE